MKPWYHGLCGRKRVVQSTQKLEKKRRYRALFYVKFMGENSLNEGILRVGIVGGGASGLFACCQLINNAQNSSEKIEITILEKMSELGKKLTLTGHGRCNITNRKDIADFKPGMNEAANFMHPSLKAFGPEDTVSFFEQVLNMELKEEDNNRMFPVADSAKVVRDNLVDYITKSPLGVKICKDSNVISVRKQLDFEVATNDMVYHFDVLILACGGASFPQTGSTGDSYKFASSLGHTVTPIRAALSGVKVAKKDREFTSALSGVSVNANASLYYSNSKAASTEGDILFTETGLSGPAIMRLSREIPSEIDELDGWIELDFAPSYTDEQFDKEFQNLITAKPDTKVVTLGANYVPQSLSRELAKRAEVTDLYAQNLSKTNRKAFVKEMKHLELAIEEAPDIKGAYVTRGGVSLKEVDRKTMESKKFKDLYIIGEALDVDGISGGYNLQACMSEAYVVSKSILG